MLIPCPRCLGDETIQIWVPEHTRHEIATCPECKGRGVVVKNRIKPAETVGKLGSRKLDMK